MTSIQDWFIVEQLKNFNGKEATLDECGKLYEDLLWEVAKYITKKCNGTISVIEYHSLLEYFSKTQKEQD